MIQAQLELTDTDLARAHSVYADSDLMTFLANVLMVMEQDALNSMIAAVSSERFHEAAKWAGFGAALTEIVPRIGSLSERYVAKRKEALE
jgi:hypothetical protein